MAEATSPLTTGQGRALQVLGHLFLRMGQFQRARKLALALLALAPADLWARRCLSVALSLLPIRRCRLFPPCRQSCPLSS